MGGAPTGDDGLHARIGEARSLGVEMSEGAELKQLRSTSGGALQLKQANVRAGGRARVGGVANVATDADGLGAAMLAARRAGV